MTLPIALALVALSLADPSGDAFGDGTLTPPTAPIYANAAALDIQSVDLETVPSGTRLSVTLGTLGGEGGGPSAAADAAGAPADDAAAPTDELAAGAAVRLAPRQARQARSVLRLRTGDSLELFDGSGAVAVVRLTKVERDDAEASIESIRMITDLLPLDLTVGLALLRGERFDLAVQKLTEIGASSIVPLAAQHCVVSYDVGREWDRRAARLRRIAIEAAEQSERVTVPRIAAPASVDGFLAEHAGKTIALVERSAGAPHLLEAALGDSVAVAVGPEGGWSESERQVIASRAQSVSLGPLILRAETAAIVAAGALTQGAWASSKHEEEG